MKILSVLTNISSTGGNVKLLDSKLAHILTILGGL